MAPTEDILTRADVAKMLKVTEGTVLTYVRKEKLPAAQLPNGWRFLKADVVAWMKQRTERAPWDPG